METLKVKTLIFIHKFIFLGLFCFQNMYSVMLVERNF